MSYDIAPIYARKAGDPTTYLLVGAPGDRGPQGPTGPEGLRGPQGASGPSAPAASGGSQHQLFTRDQAGNGVWRLGQGWSFYNLVPYLTQDWVSAGTDMSMQGIAYNSFCAVLSLKLYKHGTKYENAWINIVHGANLPDFIKPLFTIRDSLEAVELDGWVGSHFAYRFDPTGNIDISMSSMSPDWGDRTIIALRFAYPRKSWL